MQLWPSRVEDGSRRKQKIFYADFYFKTVEIKRKIIGNHMKWMTIKNFLSYFFNRWNNKFPKYWVNIWIRKKSWYENAPSTYWKKNFKLISNYRIGKLFRELSQHSAFGFEIGENGDDLESETFIHFTESETVSHGKKRPNENN